VIIFFYSPRKKQKHKPMVNNFESKCSQCCISGGDMVIGLGACVAKFEPLQSSNQIKLIRLDTVVVCVGLPFTCCRLHRSL